jgi:hypothetical protein
MYIPIQIASPWVNDEPECKINIEGYVYPHGVAAIIHFDIQFCQEDSEPNKTKQNGVGLTPMMGYALDVSKNISFSVVFDGKPSSKMKLDKVAGVVLNYLRESIFGRGTPQGSRSSDPITIATVIKADGGGNVDLPITINGELHRVLEGLCSWEEDWANKQHLETIDKANLLLSNHPAGNILYHFKHGCATWMPKHHALNSSRGQRKLECYHRNLALVSLQTEMLAQVCVLYRDYYDRNEQPPPELKLLAKDSSIRLGFLYAAMKKGSKKFTYNSASPRAHLQEYDYVNIVNSVRSEFNLQTLSCSTR